MSLHSYPQLIPHRKKRDHHVLLPPTRYGNLQLHSLAAHHLQLAHGDGHQVELVAGSFSECQFLSHRHAWLL